MRWYYANGNEQRGPVSEEDFQDLIRSGSVNGGTLVWHEGMPSWQPYGTLQAMAVAPMPAEPVIGGTAGGTAVATATGPSRYCSQCGTAHASDEMVQFGDTWVCANCKQLYAQRLREGALVTGQRHYAGFWIRFAATILDVIILWVVQLVLAVPVQLMASASGKAALGLLVTLASFVFGVFYDAWFVVNHGGTPGKMACQIRIIRADGRNLDWGLAIGRYFAKLLSSFTLLIGFIMAGVDDEKRALHDRICETRVVYK